MKTYIGIDNGVTGSIFVLGPDVKKFYKTPVKVEQSYTKTKQNISRLDVDSFFKILSSIKNKDNDFIAVVERPMVNPGRFQATVSALRCLEATIICLERFLIPIQYIDSKQWQKELLLKGLKGKELKKASMDISKRLFPLFKKEIEKQKDGDSILIAEWARRNNL